MPPIDYVSIIRSVYADRGAMLAGSVASGFAAALTAWRVGSLPLYAIAIAFPIFGLLRYLNMLAFERAAIETDDAEAAEHWENRAVVLGGLLAAVYGTWCLVAMLVVRDPYAELVSSTLTIAVMVGICARNFGLDRLVTIQMLLVIAPLSAGLLLRGDFFHPVLAVLLVIMLSSFRKLSADIRSILLSAVHGRVEASRLADELDLAITTLQHGLCLLDHSGSVTVANHQARALFSRLGCSDLVGTPLNPLLKQLDEAGRLPSSAVRRLTALIDRQASGKVLFALDQDVHYEVSVSSSAERSVLLIENISERVAAEQRIKFMARHDTLTGLPNRSYFGEIVAEDLSSHIRSDARRKASLMLVDIDEFKHVNDTHGHVIGDELLQQVAKRLAQALPKGAVLARLGGDEFVIYSGLADPIEDVEAECDVILAAFASPFALDGVTLDVSVSLGVVTSESAEDGLDELMTKADLALYRAKADGKAKSQVFHTQMDTDYLYRQRLKADLRQAVQDRALSLAFQPLLDLQSRKVVTCEALARWEHPELGAIPPSVFIPIAEEIGIISDITRWVIDEAARQCSLWPEHVGVAVNVSARDFRAIDLLAVIDDALARTRLDPARFEIEVTETALIEEQGIAQQVLSELAARKVGIALDDFGTGYSSLSYLNALPFSKLKVDGSFVAEIDTKPQALRLLANVARLGQDLDLIVVAEGVETETQLEAIIAQTSIQQVQGYLFSRPLPQRDISELILRLNKASATPSKRRHG